MFAYAGVVGLHILVLCAFHVLVLFTLHMLMLCVLRALYAGMCGYCELGYAVLYVCMCWSCLLAYTGVLHDFHILVLLLCICWCSLLAYDGAVCLACSVCILVRILCA